jgi:hypothetical protein
VKARQGVGGLSHTNVVATRIAMIEPMSQLAVLVVVISFFSSKIKKDP